MVVSIQQKERVKKAALFFAGLGHLQPLLLSATNSDYLLDRFLLERRCSQEYTSRMVTSFIFIEVLATILMGSFGVLLGLYPDFFKGISREKEEDFRGCLTCVIQWILLFGHAQILRAFTSGGEKGHIQWFYFALLFQHFFTCIIGAGIGFIDVDRALWYFMTLPMSPVLIFFYQMFIHMWARKNGLAYPAYLVVKSQIWLGIFNSFMVMTLWTSAYFPGFYPSQPIPDVLEIRMELNKTESYDCTISGLNRVYMLVSQVSGNGDPPHGYTKYHHTPDTSGHFKDKKLIVKEIYCDGEQIKKVSFPETECCNHAEVYQGGRKWLLVKLLMEDGSAYYYCSRKGSWNNEWCVYKVSKENLEKIKENLKAVLEQAKAGFKDSDSLQNILNPGSIYLGTKTTSNSGIKLNLINTRNYVCESGNGGKDTVITVTSVELTEGLSSYYCHVHAPSSKTLALDNPVNGISEMTLSHANGSPPKNVDHAHVYRDPKGQPVLLVVVTTNGEKWYYGKKEDGVVRSVGSNTGGIKWIGAKLDEDRYLTEGDLVKLLTKACKGFEQDCFQKNLNRDGACPCRDHCYSSSKNDLRTDTTVHDHSHKHTVCLDLKNICEYLSKYNNRSDDVKTLISVEEETELQICSEYTKFAHRLDSGSKFCIENITHSNTGLLDIRPCIEGLVDEVSVYYGGGIVDINNPLLLCIKKSKPSGTGNNDTYCYYCKGDDGCWYRYRYGESEKRVKIPAEGEDDKCTETGLCKLLTVLKGGKVLDSEKFKDISQDKYLQKFQSDHNNYDYWKVLGNHDGGSWWNPLNWRLSQTCMPLFMHGFAVGAMGSIYPHLVPKTLVSAKQSSTFNVLSMFLAPTPHIFNLFLAETKNPAFAGVDWILKPWYLAWLLYIPYLLSFLLIIFNIHYPDWNICCYIRSHTWLAFLIMLSVSFTNDIFLAVGRGGIMDQRSGNKRLGGDGKGLKNDHSLYNKIAPFMALSYIPFWLTTSPMIKSYAHSVCQLSDKDRTSWPTSCCGFWSSFGYWCKCGCHGLYTSLPKLLTFDMRTTLTHKDDRLFILVTSDLPKEEWFTDW